MIESEARVKTLEESQALRLQDDAKAAKEAFNAVKPTTDLTTLMSFYRRSLRELKPVYERVKSRPKQQNAGYDPLPDLHVLMEFYTRCVAELEPVKEVFGSMESNILNYLRKIQEQEASIRKLRDEVASRDTKLQSYTADLVEAQEQLDLYSQDLDALEKLIPELKEKLLQTCEERFAEKIPDSREVAHLLEAVMDQECRRRVSTLSADFRRLSMQQPSTTLAEVSKRNSRARLSRHMSEGRTLEDAAAMTIQAVFRGYKSRKQYRRIVVRQLVANEILETELSYVSRLSSLMENYIEPLRSRLQAGHPVLTGEQQEAIFFQIPEIVLFNTSLQLKIQDRVSRWSFMQSLGDVFLQVADGLDIYTQYVNNYNNALKTLRACEEQQAYKLFVSEIRAKQEKRALDLKDLLIMPIQRIPRYLLLLQELLKRTDKSHPDYENISKSISHIKKVAAIINERKRESEMFQAVAEIASKLQGLPRPFEVLAFHSSWFIFYLRS